MNKFKIMGIIIDTKSCIITAFILGIIIVIIAERFNLSRIQILATVAAIYAVIILFVYMLLSIETIKAINELENKCNPYNFLSKINNMATHIKSPKSIKNWILLNKTAGLNEIGDFDDGINILKQINVNELGYIHRALYYNNIVSCYIGKFLFKAGNDKLVELAEDNLDKLLEMIDNRKMNKKYLELFQTSYKLNKIYLNMCKNKYESCIEQLEECCSRTEQLRLNVNCRFGMGYCYYMNNDKLKSKKHFEYVITNGNKLCIVKQAQKYIEEMN